METYCTECGKKMKEINFKHKFGDPIYDRGFKCSNCKEVYKEATVIVKLERIDGYKELEEQITNDKYRNRNNKIKLDGHGLPESD